MKKYIMIICISFLLIGCSNKDNASSASSTLPPDEVDEINNESNYSEIEDDNSANIQSTFEITSSEICNIVFGKNVDNYSKNINGYDVDVFPNGDYFLFCVSSIDEDFPMLIYTYDQSASGTSESSTELIKPFYNLFSDNENIKFGNCNIGESMRTIITYAYVINSCPEDFIPTIQVCPDTDYFLSTDAEKYKIACIEGRYDDIFYDVQSYIENTNPPSYDSAYIIQSSLSPIMDDWENIEVQYDSVEKYALFYYTNVNSINNNIHFVPYATSNERNIFVLMGFYDSDWLFFEHIILSSDENILFSTTNNKIEDVIDGGKIYEADTFSLNDNDLQEILSHSNYTIRFKAQDDTFKDYEISAEEYEAFVSIAKFQNVRNILSDLLYHFQKRL